MLPRTILVLTETLVDANMASDCVTQENISPKKSKLLIVAAHEGKGNAHIEKYIPSLAKAGYQITFVGWDRKKKLPASYREENVVYKFIFRGGGYASKWLMFVLPFWCFRLFCHLLFQKPDLIIAIDLECGFPASLANIFRLRRIPVVYAIRDTYALRASVPKFLRRPVQMVDNWVIKMTDKIIVPDESRILEDYKNKDKFTVIYNCCRDLSDDVSAERKERKDKPFTILATGYLLKSRGIKLLLQATEYLSDINILMAGSIYEKDLQDMVASNQNVKFMGKIPLDDAYRLNFDVDVVFTFYDPSSEINRRAASNKWADAMMASRPILVNSELVRAEWIYSNDMGYLCPYGDVESLVKCLEHIRANPVERKQKGRNGRKLFEEGYNWNVMENRLWQLMEKLTDRP